MDTPEKRLDLEAKIVKYNHKLGEAETRLAEVESWWSSEPRSSPLHRRLELLRSNVRTYRTMLNDAKRDRVALGD